MTRINNLIITEKKKYFDERGYFLENWRKHDLIKVGIPEDFFDNNLQNNISISKKGTIRGMHFQGWSKLMSVVYGKFKMTFVDLRIESSTYKNKVTVDIEPGMTVYIPKGVANGVQALEENSILSYLVTDYWKENKDYLGFQPLDEDLNIEWNKDIETIVSKKDNNSLTWNELINIVENRGGDLWIE